jgi:hypothetical protein
VGAPGRANNLAPLLIDILSTFFRFGTGLANIFEGA